MTETWYEFAVELGKLAMAGGIGAYIVHRLDHRRFRKEEKFRDDQKKRDALRDILGDVVEDMRAVLNTSAHDQPNEDALLERARQLHKRVEVVAPLFHNNKRVFEALGYIGRFVGMAGAPSFTRTATDFAQFQKQVDVLYEELEIMDKCLSG